MRTLNDVKLNSWLVILILESLECRSGHFTSILPDYKSIEQTRQQKE